MFSSEVGDNDRQTQTVLRASGPAVCSTSLPVYKSQGKKRRLGVATKAADSQTPSSCGVRAQPLYSEPRSSDLRTSGAAKTEDAVPLHCSPEGAVRSGGPLIQSRLAGQREAPWGLPLTRQKPLLAGLGLCGARHGLECGERSYMLGAPQVNDLEPQLGFPVLLGTVAIAQVTDEGLGRSAGTAWTHPNESSPRPCLPIYWNGI